MDEAKRVAVNIVTWNSMAYLPNLLSSLDEQDTRDFMVTMVDNASTDGTVAWLQEQRPDVAALRNFRNQGFARAHNQAIAMVLSRWSEDALESRYVLVTNPDLEFASDAIRKLTEFMDAHPEIAACGPKLLRAKTVAGDLDGGRETDRTTIIDSAGIVMYRSRRHADRGAGEEDTNQYAAGDVFGLSGACAMFRASALVASKLAGEVFDEDFFAYKEDVDLAWRMRRLGYRAAYVPEAIAWHHRRAKSVEQGFLWLKAFVHRFTKPAYANRLSTRNHVWLIIKNDSFWNIIMHLPWILPYEFGKTLVGLFSPSTWQAWGQAIIGIPGIWKKRNELSKRTVIQPSQTRRWFV
ncbi:MAG: glycosyltransferase family 2 protein [Patescibacteria group bacterium]|jgi:GT2 family glycosyltransferase